MSFILHIQEYESEITIQTSTGSTLKYKFKYNGTPSLTRQLIINGGVIDERETTTAALNADGVALINVAKHFEEMRARFQKLG